MVTDVYVAILDGYGPHAVLIRTKPSNVRVIDRDDIDKEAGGAPKGELEWLRVSCKISAKEDCAQMTEDWGAIGYLLIKGENYIFREYD